MSDGRSWARSLEAKLSSTGDGIALYAPSPGLWREAPPAGALIRAGSALGELEILGELHRLVAPAGAFGVVTRLPEGRRLGRRPVDCGTRLMVLDPEGVAGGAELAAAGPGAASEGPVFRAPLGGRYYARPAPDAEPFVKVGAALSGGETVAIIEVMKTFNRVKYAGEPARIARIVPADGADLEAGDVILELGPT